MGSSFCIAHYSTGRNVLLTTSTREEDPESKTVGTKKEAEKKLPNEQHHKEGKDCETS